MTSLDKCGKRGMYEMKNKENALGIPVFDPDRSCDCQSLCIPETNTGMYYLSLSGDIIDISANTLNITTSWTVVLVTSWETSQYVDA